MRLSIFVGLLYVAWCINPIMFDTIQNSIPDIIVIGYVSWMALFADLREYKNRKQ